MALAGLEIDWQETDPEKVLVGVPDQGKAQALIRLYEKVTRNKKYMRYAGRQQGQIYIPPSRH
ncbi:MAG: hypothetical protein ACJ76Y_08845 [Thermoanaerobaculia bacterium]